MSKQHYESSRTEAKFNRRRCPSCGAGLFRQVPNAPGMRLCRTCGGTFDLIKEGVVPNLKPKKAPAEKSGVIAEPCREREFRELHRNPFEHLELAMTTRRT